MFIGAAFISPSNVFGWTFPKIQLIETQQKINWTFPEGNNCYQVPELEHVRKHMFDPNYRKAQGKIQLWFLKWMFPKIMVPPNHPFFWGFSIIFTIHFGGNTPVIGNTLSWIISKEILGCFWMFLEVSMVKSWCWWVYDERSFKKGGWSMNLMFLWPTRYTVPGGECGWINDVELLIISFRISIGTFHFLSES